MSNNNTSSSKPAACYLRRSTDRQEQSISDQRRAIEEYSSQHGYQLVKEYVDDAVSGASVDGREAFLEMIRDSQRPNHPFRYVLVYDLKRFGRLDSDEAGYFRHKLRQAGVEVVYITEGFCGDDSDDLIRPVKQWQARQELRDLSKVTTRGLISRANGGWWVGGRPPYGYDILHITKAGEFLCIVRYEPNGSRLVLDEQGEITRILSKEDNFIFSKSDRSKLVLSSSERSELIERIFKLYTVDGYGFRSICEQLNQEGILPPTGGLRKGVKFAKWTSSSIASILQNPIFTGDMVWNRLSFGKFHKISKDHAVPIKRFFGHIPDSNPEEDWIVTRDAHPAIISRLTFERARKRRENTARFGYANSHRVGRGARSSYLLTSLIRCKYCGHKWSGYTVHRGRRENRNIDVKTLYYICGSYLSKGRSACPRHVVSKSVLENWVVSTIKHLLMTYFGSAEGLRQLQRAVEREVDDHTNLPADRVKRIDAAILVLRGRMNMLVDSLTPANRDLVDHRLIELQRELASLEAEREELALAESCALSRQKLLTEAAKVADEFLQYFEHGSIDEQRELIRHFVHGIEIDPIAGTGTVNITLLPGMEREFNMPASKKSAIIGRRTPAMAVV